MSSDGADRSRRWRQRKEKCEVGDHSLCSPRTKCPRFAAASPAPVTTAGDVTGDVTPSPTVGVTQLAPPADLGARGAALWGAVDTAGMGPLHLVLLEEACRIADTLAALRGDAEDGRLLELVRNEAESSESVVEVRVVVNPLLAEIRQQQHAYRQKVAELRVAGRSGAPGVAVPPAVPERPEDGDVPAAVGGEDLGDLIDAAGRFTAPR